MRKAAISGTIGAPSALDPVDSYLLSFSPQPEEESGASFKHTGIPAESTAAIIRDDRTYAPIRYLAEYFGYIVGWDAATRTVTITG